MGIGKAVDGAVADDPLQDGIGKMIAQCFRAAGHEVAEQIAGAGGGIVFRQEEVGQVVQLAPMERVTSLGAMEALRRGRRRARFPA